MAERSATPEEAQNLVRLVTLAFHAADLLGAYLRPASDERTVLVNASLQSLNAFAAARYSTVAEVAFDIKRAADLLGIECQLYPLSAANLDPSQHN